MVRKLLWGSLALAPITILVDKLAGAGDVTLFVLAAIALIPLAWLIGESTEHAAEHTGPGIGGFLNASFGNAPELIVALFAVGADLPVVVRGSLAGSVISNLLLVYGVTQIVGPDEARIDRRSLLVQLALVGAAVIAFALPTALGYAGAPPDRHAVVVASVPVAIVLLLLYLVVVGRNLQRHREGASKRDEPEEGAWSLTASLVALAVATGATAWVCEILVHSLGAFAKAVGLSDFFIAVVVVAVVGNAAEHGGAIVIARNGKMRLASEIAISSSAQVALLVVPVVTLLSLLFSHHLALAFAWSELFAMAGAAVVVTAVVWDGRSSRREGTFLVVAYAAAVVGFLLGGGR
ncbi:MAG TPA: calcium/proton exchanger [Gaiellaceae bacterium]|nr:calcium/proton exchanger [Gaiellaceae bacterium]